MGLTTMMFWYVPMRMAPLVMGTDSEVPSAMAMRCECALNGSFDRNSRQAASPPGQSAGPDLRHTR